MAIERLTEYDYPELKKLIGTEPQRVGFSHTLLPNEEYMKYLYVCLTHPAHQTYAYINDQGEFVSFISLADFGRLPYYGIVNFKVVKKFNTYNQEENGIHQFQDVYFSKEKEDRYSFFKLRGFRSERLMKKVTRGIVNAMPEFFDRYHRTIEEYIPAGQLSKWEAFNKMLLRGRPMKEDCVVFKFTCKQEFRTNIPSYIQEATMQMEQMKGIKLAT